MAEHRRSGKLAVILHADVAGSTGLVQQDEQIAHERIQHTFHRFSDTITKYQGRVRELRGDALLAEFERASSAVSAALAFQADQSDYVASLSDPIQPVIRVGVAMGEVVIADDTITGEGVVLAQRLEQLATPGGVVIQAAAVETIPGRFPFEYVDLGAHAFKGFSKSFHAYSVFLKSNEVVPTPERTDHRLRNILVAVATIAAVTAGIVAIWFKPWEVRDESASVEQTPFTLPDKPSIAVLPFTNMGGVSEDQYFADGMTDDLITDLSKISSLLVIARNTVFTYKDKAVDIKKVGKELSVSHVLEGSVRRLGDNMRINAQLIDATSGHHVWAQRYDRGTADIFKIQDEVIGQIVSALAVNLTEPEREQLVRMPTTNLEAYDYYQRAEQGTYLAVSSTFRETLAFYEKAIELDPDFADAYAGYARTQVELWRLDFNNLVSGAVARKRAYAAATKALELDSGNPRAYSVLGVLQVVEGRHNEAINSARRAVSLAPNDADSHLNLGLVLAFSGIHAEAIEHTEWALKLNPKPNPGEQWIAGFVFFTGRLYGRAIELLEKSRDASPDTESGRDYLAAAYAWSDQLAKAKAEVDAYTKILHAGNIRYSALNHIYYKERQDLDHLLDGLRKAGLSEWPFGFEGNADDRLHSTALQGVTMGRTWTGTHQNGVPFMQYIGQEGEFVYRSANSFQTGVAKLEEAQLCLQIEGYILSQPFCGYVYTNRKGTQVTNDQYIYVTPEAVKYFSVQ